MRRFLLPTVVVAAAAALLALLAFGVSSQGANTSIDAQLAKGKRPAVPDAQVALPMLGSSARRSIADLRGQVVVLNVFAGWCTSCTGEAPVLESEQKMLRHHNATILGVTYLDDSGDAERFVHTWHLTFPVIRDVNSKLVPSLGTTGVPETFVIDRQGRIAAVRRYPIDSAWLTKTLRPILAEPS
jgi:cytochrome c biogenesis protein CcmG, thiol:disulfide interchange protein DsbE